MRKNNPFCLSFGKEPDRYVGIIDGSEYGYVSLALPRFDKYVEIINELL